MAQYQTSAFPVRFISPGQTRYLYTQDADPNLIAGRYEFLLYRQLRRGLESGDVFYRDSVCFRSFESDLLINAQWRDKDKLLSDTGLTLLKQPICERLAELEQQLEARLDEANRRIATGENEHFQIKKRDSQTR